MSTEPTTWVQLWWYRLVPLVIYRCVLQGNTVSLCLLGDGTSKASPAQPGQHRGASLRFQELQRWGEINVWTCSRNYAFTLPLQLCYKFSATRRYDITCLKCCWPPWTSCSHSTNAWRGRQRAPQDARRGTWRTKTWWEVCKGRGMFHHHRTHV